MVFHKFVLKVVSQAAFFYLINYFVPLNMVTYKNTRFRIINYYELIGIDCVYLVTNYGDIYLN